MSNIMNGRYRRPFLRKQQGAHHMNEVMFTTGFSHLFYGDYSTAAGLENNTDSPGRMDRNPFVTMMKNIVNGLISPAKNFDISSSNMHRQKLANCSMGVTNEINFLRPERGDRLHDILELAVCPGSSTHSPILVSSKQQTKVPTANKVESEVIAIPLSENFLDLHIAEKPLETVGTSEDHSPTAATSQTTTSRKSGSKRQEAEFDSSDDNFVILNRCGLLQSPSCSFENDDRPNILCLKQRQISECSEDSFVICFTEDAPEGVIEVISDASEFECDTDTEEETDEDDDDDEEEEDEDGEDEIDSNSRHFPKKTENCFLINAESTQPDSGFSEDIPRKKVRFNLNPEVHLMCAWNFAYRAARKGHWETYARDRDRFKRRIEGLEHILNPVLDSDYRKRIYMTRFCDNTSPDKNEPLDDGTNCAKATN